MGISLEQALDILMAVSYTHLHVQIFTHLIYVPAFVVDINIKECIKGKCKGGIVLQKLSHILFKAII